MLYKVTHWLCENELAYVVEREGEVAKVQLISKNIQKWIHSGWLEEYTVNKGKFTKP